MSSVAHLENDTDQDELLDSARVFMGPGWWSVVSETDPRWNASGRGSVGGRVLLPDAAWAIREKERQLGGKPPADLQFTYGKDGALCSYSIPVFSSEG